MFESICIIVLLVVVFVVGLLVYRNNQKKFNAAESAISQASRKIRKA